MTQPQSCRECRHSAYPPGGGLLRCHWSENVQHPFWHKKIMPEFVWSDEGEDCLAFERKDDADDE